MKTTLLTTLLALFIILGSNGYANTSKTGMRNITSQQLVSDMGVGWNLGNTFDAKGKDETAWRNPYTTKAMIDEVAKKGFKTIRIPVTWQYHLGDAPEYKIEKAWLERVEEVANYAFSNNMYVIINIHHDDDWIIPTYEKLDQVNDQLGKVWTQIANHFKDYGDYLIMETLNEPRHVGSEKEWIGGTPEGRDCVNQMHKTCVDAIRATGGNNKKRHLLVSSYAANGSPEVISDFEIPNFDKRVIVSLHNYGPIDFCLFDKNPEWGTKEERSAMVQDLDRIYNHFVANNRAVIIGEWGSSHQNNVQDRTQHAQYFANACVQRDICPILWDNGQAKEFGVFNRRELTWNYSEIVDAIVQVKKDKSISGNPIIKHIRTADPSVEIWEDGKLWMYASHDPDWAKDYSTMDGYHVFSSWDMVNWTDHGEVLHSRDVEWGVEQGGFMFAPDAAFKNGTYYLYYPHMSKDWKWRVGVATSKVPEGPFTDVGFVDGTDHIDPTVFVDDDGSAYLMWCGGYQTPKIGKLKENMIEFAEEPRAIEYGADNCGEGPYMHKYNGKYYFSYTSHSSYPVMSYYAIGDSPYGPFEYKGGIGNAGPGAQDHHSMIEYHNQWYYFYHRGDFSDQGSGARRTVCVDSMFYNPDGTIQFMKYTKQGVGLDLIGATQGELIPGVVKGTSYFSKNADRNSSKVTAIRKDDCVEYILEIKGNADYELSFNTSKIKKKTKVEILVDNTSVKTVELNSKTVIPLFLNGGKHTLKLTFSNEKTEGKLLDLNSFELQSTTQFYTIEPTSTLGGSIYPNERKYIPKGGEITLRMDNEDGYKLDKILVNGSNFGTEKSITISNVLEDTKIEAFYSSCPPAKLTPSFVIKEQEEENGTTIVIDEGTEITLNVNPDESGTINWFGPEDLHKSTSSKTFKAQAKHLGVHSAVFENDKGCKTQVDFAVKVKPVVLDVFEGEDWIEQEGLQTEKTSDVGAGQNVGYINPDDWATYAFNVNTTGTYDLVTRVSTASNGGYIEITSNNKVIATIEVDGEKSNGWQDWFTTEAVEVQLEAGEQNWKFTFKGNDGLLMNFNWFDLLLKK